MTTEKPERFLNLLALLLQLEGGVSNNKNDKGGLTNCGVTQATYDEYTTSQKKKNKNVKLITKSEIEDIYFNNYYSKIDYIEEEYPHYLMFDLAVNSGPGRVKQCIREISNPHDPAAVLAWRRQWYRDIIANNPSQDIFLGGWMNRLKLIQKHYGT